MMQNRQQHVRIQVGDTATDNDTEAVHDDILRQVQVLGKEADEILESIRDGSFFTPTPRTPSSKKQNASQRVFSFDDDDDDMKEDTLQQAVDKIRQDLDACSGSMEAVKDVRVALSRRHATAIEMGAEEKAAEDNVEEDDHKRGSLSRHVICGPVIIVWGVVAVVGLMQGSFRWFVTWSLH